MNKAVHAPRNRARTITLVLAFVFSISQNSTTWIGNAQAAPPTGGDWEITSVTAPGVAVQGRSLVVDGNGVPHVTFVTPDNVLHYSTRIGSSWTDTIVSTDVAPAPAVIRTDPSGVLHMVFMKIGPSVWYATRNGSSWDMEKVEDVAIDPWLAFDSSGRPHVLFQDARPLPPAGGGWGLVHTTKSGGNWTWETVALRDCTSNCPAAQIAVDGSNRLHVVYPLGNSLRYAYKDGGTWSDEPVTASGLVPWLALDAAGKPRLAYTLPGPDVMLATRTGTTWTLQLVDGEVVAGVSQAIDRYNNSHLAYCDQRPVPPNGPGLGLRYSFKRGLRWIVEEVDGMAECSDAIVALNSLGRPFVLYYDKVVQQLQLARWKWPSSTSAIPASGGSLVSQDGQTTCQFPAGTFSAAVTVTQEPLFPASLPAAQGLLGIGHGFEVQAVYDDTGEPAEPVVGNTFSISVHYSQTDLAGVDEHSLGLYSWNGSAWLLEPTSKVDEEADTVTATPNHLSLWSVMGITHSLFLPWVTK